MTEAEKNVAFYREQYEKGLAAGRGVYEFGMQWIANQINLWEADARKERQKD